MSNPETGAGIPYPTPDDELATTDSYLKWMVEGIDRAMSKGNRVEAAYNGAVNGAGLGDVNLSAQLSAIGGAVLQLEGPSGGSNYVPVVQPGAPPGHLYFVVFKFNPSVVRPPVDHGPLIPAAGAWVTVRIIAWGTPV